MATIYERVFDAILNIRQSIGAVLSVAGKTGAVELEVADLVASDGAAAASTGEVGEILSNTTFTNSVVDGTAENVCPLELTQGEWDLQATVLWDSTSATTTTHQIQIVDEGLSSLTTTLGVWPATTSSLSVADTTKLVRVRITEDTTYDIRVIAGFSAGSVQVTLATLEARRVL